MFQTEDHSRSRHVDSEVGARARSSPVACTPVDDSGMNPSAATNICVLMYSQRSPIMKNECKNILFRPNLSRCYAGKDPRLDLMPSIISSRSSPPGPHRPRREEGPCVARCMRCDFGDTSLGHTVMCSRQTLIGDSVILMPDPDCPPRSDLCEDFHGT